MAVVAQLRNPNGGCPWDLAQTHQSLLPYVLEEAHEVADALRSVMTQSSAMNSVICCRWCCMPSSLPGAGL